MTQLSKRFLALSLGGVAMVGACRDSNRSTAGDTTAGGAFQPGSLEGVRRNSGGEVVGSQPSPTEAAVDTNLRDMMGASSDQLQAMVPRHQQVVASMIGGMNQQIGFMHTPESAAWMATRDSIDGDLTRLPMMNARDLQAMLPAHEARLRRLMQLQGRMRAGRMGGMGGMMPNR